MGMLRLFVEETPAVETTVPLPEYWDEFDEEEKKEWVAKEYEYFKTAHIKSGFNLSE